MRNLVALTVILTFFFSFLSVPITAAHESSSSGDLKATIHISPDDLPIAQQHSKIELKVTDDADHFNFTHCNCTLIISNDTTTIAELPLQGEGSTTSTSYTFADSGEYFLTFRGESLDTKQHPFTPFSLSYNYVVKPPAAGPAQEVNAQPKSTDNTFLLLSGGATLTALAIVSLLIIIKKKSRQ